jgi:hypothetical protein
MSRDWTPQELWHVEKHMVERGKSMRESSIFFVDAKTGEEIPLISKKEKEIGKSYPVLSFLFEDWYKIYIGMEDEDARHRTFCYMEQALKATIAEEEGKPFNFPLESFKIVKFWYRGELDTNFYYRERNDEKFADYIWTVYKATISAKYNR